MFNKYPLTEISEVRHIIDERQVEGLIILCKEMAGKSEVEKAALKFIPFDKNIVKEAVRRVLNR